MAGQPTRTGNARRACCCAVICMAAVSTQAFAQTLNDAVTAQLAADNNLDPCGLLLAGDPVSVLGSAGLFAICDRSISQGSVPPSSSGGGLAATPPSRPSAVESRLREEEADEEEGPSMRGLFFQAEWDAVDREVSPFEDGYDSDVVRIVAGYDVLLSDSWVLGFAVDGSEQEGDFLDGGDFQIRSLGITGFGARLLGDAATIDFYAGYSTLSNERQRRATFVEIEDPADPFEVTGDPTADFDAEQLLAGVKYSHDWSRDNVTLGPRLGFDVNRTTYDTYSEVDDSGLALTFYENDEVSSQFSAGLEGSVAVSTKKFGALLVQESITYRYETDQDQRNVDVSFVEDTRARRFAYETEDPDRDFIEFSVGATFILRGGLQVLLEYRGIASHDHLDSNAIGFGFRKEL